MCRQLVFLSPLYHIRSVIFNDCFCIIVYVLCLPCFMYVWTVLIQPFRLQCLNKCFISYRKLYKNGSDWNEKVQLLYFTSQQCAAMDTCI